jgi:hypothetical protein
MISPTINPFIRDETPVDRPGDDRTRCSSRRDRDDSDRLEDLLIRALELGFTPAELGVLIARPP